MRTKADKKENMREQIILASHVYREQLSGKVFLYVYGNSFFEVVFKTDCFMHLTGVASKLSASDFYGKANKSALTTNQFYFDQAHPYHAAKKKLPCLIRLPEITNSLVCVVKDLRTVTLTYKIGVTNLKFTIGLTENIDFQGRKINGWFLPRTLRVKDKSVENSSFAEFIDFIFSKDASAALYSDLLFAAPDKKPSPVIRHFLNAGLVSRIYREQQGTVG